MDSFFIYFFLFVFLAFCIFVLFQWRRRLIEKKLLRNQITSSHPTELSKFENVDSVRIHYYQVGRGPHLVLIHGIGASTYTWRKVVEPLRKHFTITVIDIPGFGFSTKDPSRDHGLDTQVYIIEKFLTQLGIQQARLVGSSMGGAIALWLSLKFPERFFEVIAISPATFPELTPFRPGSFALLARPLKVLVNKTLIRQILKRIYWDSTIFTEEDVEAYTLPYLDNGESVQTFVRALDLVGDKRFPHNLSQIKSRLLLMWGENDQMVPLKYGKNLQSIIRHSSFISNPNTGHHPMEEQPKWVVENIKSFFKPENF